MGFITISLIAIGLAMDAFAVAITNGITVPNFRKRHAVLVGLYFGAFQFAMPIIGWLLGTSFRKYIESFDHWIAFVLLVMIGGHMILESFKDDEGVSKNESIAKKLLTPKRLIMQAIATSIDALAVGVSFAVLNVNIFYASSIIGIVAFVFSIIGGILGKKLGAFLNKGAETIGGMILIGIGIKILAEHLF